MPLNFQGTSKYDIDEKQCFQGVDGSVEVQSALAPLSECLARHDR